MQNCYTHYSVWTEIIRWNHKLRFLLFISHKSTWHRGRTWAATVTLCFICRASAMSESRVAKHRRSRKWKLSIGIQDVTKLYFILLQREQCLYKNWNSQLPLAWYKIHHFHLSTCVFPTVGPKRGQSWKSQFPLTWYKSCPILSSPLHSSGWSKLPPALPYKRHNPSSQLLHYPPEPDHHP